MSGARRRSGAAGGRGEHLGRALERRALPARRARAGTLRRDPRQHRRRHRRRRPRRKVVLWNSAAERLTGDSGRGHARSPPSPRAAAEPRGARGRGDDGDRRAGHARPRGSVAVRHGGRDARPGRRRRRPDLRFRDISGDRLVEQIKWDPRTVSHELRTPLTSIYGLAETLLRRDVMFGDEERQTYLRYIAWESPRLTTIVDALLNVARLDTGDLQVSPAQPNVRDGRRREGSRRSPTPCPNGHRLVDAGAGRAARRAGGSRRAASGVRRSSSTTPSATRRRRHGDGRRSSPQGDGRGQRRGRGDRHPRGGAGADLRKFYRGAESARAGAGGTGLGLFIARGLVTAMGGRIWVFSRRGRGFPLRVRAAGRGPRRDRE